MKKIWLLMLLTVLTALLLTGCASSADTLPSPTPGTTSAPGSLMPDMTGDNSPMPAETDAPGESPAPLSMTAQEAKDAAEAMEKAIEKLTEVDEAEVAITGDTALVGLELTSQYQGQVDDRLKKMVLTRVQTVEKGITKVAVTDNAALRAAIEALEDLNDGAGGLEEMNRKAEEILKQLTVYSD